MPEVLLPGRCIRYIIADVGECAKDRRSVSDPRFALKKNHLPVSCDSRIGEPLEKEKDK